MVGADRDGRCRSSVEEEGGREMTFGLLKREQSLFSQKAKLKGAVAEEKVAGKDSQAHERDLGFARDGRGIKLLMGRAWKGDGGM